MSLYILLTKYNIILLDIILSLNIIKTRRPLTWAIHEVFFVVCHT